MQVEERARSVADPQLLTVFDTDIHPVTRTDEELAEYTPEPWRSRNYGRQWRVPATAPVHIFPPPQADVGGVMRETIPPHGGRAASDPVFTEQQLFERSAVDYGILIPLIARPKVNPAEEAANCTAVNRWLAATWLSEFNTHDIYRGTLRVACQDPDAMVREVEEWIGHPGFVQVMLDPGNPSLFGEPKYDKFFALCERESLVVGFHVIKGYRFLTPVGTPSYWTEYMSGLALTYATQMVSMVLGGVFEKNPRLKVAFIEGGFAWLLPLMYRMDKYWKELRSDVPWLKRKPSDYIRDQIRFDTQPFEESTDPKVLDRMFDYIGCDKMFMFASDYPHCDGDVPLWVYKRIPAHLRDGILRDNALEFYDLPRKSTGPVLATAS